MHKCLDRSILFYFAVQICVTVIIIYSLNMYIIPFLNSRYHSLPYTKSRFWNTDCCRSIYFFNECCSELVIDRYCYQFNVAYVSLHGYIYNILKYSISGYINKIIHFPKHHKEKWMKISCHCFTKLPITQNGAQNATILLF